MQKCKKFFSSVTIFLFLFSFLGTAQAAPPKDALGLLTSPTMPAAENGSSSLKIVDTLLSFLVDKILGPLLQLVESGHTASAHSTPFTGTIPKLPKKPASPVNGGVLQGKTIVIDPGHGGSNPGAVANGVEEADINLATSLKLRDLLAQSGAKVILTRDVDRKVAPESTNLAQELAARVNIASQNNADILVSIHANYNPQSAINGAMTFYYSDLSSALARSIQDGLINATGAADKGIQSESFQVIRSSPMPSALIETGFLSNTTEAANLNSDSYQTKMAQGIYNGIANYFDK
ncbi:MAG: N-acetylmuramoyl-L-alanine amidase [Sporomusaceae bacterium]|jgi:N-acetylmuramoyl-L-alanine amidase|nr:N-acetylmuramoyl-L-alanine amidase [Sporomusaceae bacterium]